MLSGEARAVNRHVGGSSGSGFELDVLVARQGPVGCREPASARKVRAVAGRLPSTTCATFVWSQTRHAARASRALVPCASAG